MRDYFLDQGVFIRSLTTRGSGGDVSASLREAAQILDAMASEAILVETIGAGQDQVEIVGMAHMVVLVLSPWTGDEVRGIKARRNDAAV